MDTDKLRQLLDQRDKLDDEIRELVNGDKKKPQRCSKCGEEGHSIRTCPQKSPA